MNRDEARVWMAQNPDREVIDARGWIWKCTESGLLAVRGEDTCWRDAVAGLMPTATFTIVEPEKPKEDELGKALDDFNFQPHAFGGKWLAPILRAEIARIADERIAKAKIQHTIGCGDWVLSSSERIVPGDE